MRREAVETAVSRFVELPNVPALAETPSLAGVDIDSWYGLFAPTGTDAAIIMRLTSQLRDTLTDAELARRMSQAGLQPSYLPPPAFATLLQRERESLIAAVAAAGIKPE